MPLGVISEVVAQGGYLSQLAELSEQKTTFFNKKNGAAFSVFWAIFCFFLAIVFGGILNINRVGEFFSAVGIMGGILILLVSLVYLPRSRKKRPDQQAELPSARAPQGLYGDAGNAALPPQQSYPASAYAPPAGWRAPDTSEFAVPGSVTDSTTKLLNKDEE
jgi:hypothetical protein